MSDVITQKDLLGLVDEWLGQGKRVAGPSKIKEGLFLYAPLMASDQLALTGFVRPANSIKEFFFPRHEKIYRYTFKGHTIELEDVNPDGMEQVIVAARPCDAASLTILDPLFNWDYEDTFYTSRRKASTVVTLACTESDSQCFCTSVGLAPDAEKGSDVLLLAANDGCYEVRCLTEKGKALFEGKTTQPGAVKTVPVAEPKTKVDVVPIKKILEDNFENPAWKGIALRCLGCGACAYVCPTCHCFDIVDEGNASGGARCKNWDSCQFGMFTLHASGHNPRSSQSQRQRQRIQHKFRVYPEKFDEILCTGCGNCTRNCPVGLGVLTALDELLRAAGNTSEVK